MEPPLRLCPDFDDLKLVPVCVRAVALAPDCHSSSHVEILWIIINNEFWQRQGSNHSGKNMALKIAKFWFSKSIFQCQKIIGIVLIFFSLKKIRLGNRLLSICNLLQKNWKNASFSKNMSKIEPQISNRTKDILKVKKKCYLPFNQPIYHLMRKLLLKKGACILFFYHIHSHSHNDISNVYPLVLSKATG